MHNLPGTQTDQGLRSALAERELLFAELQHRTRNTMQMISAFVALNDRHAQGEEAKLALRKVARMLDGINLAERSLTTFHGMEKIQLGAYLRAVLEGIICLEGRAGIILEITLRQEVQTSVRQARALGLLIGELATNSLKHAFPNGKGTLRLTLCGGERSGELHFVDDGVGWTEAAASVGAGPLGLGLVASLAQQADAELRLDGDQGMRARLRFPLDVQVYQRDDAASG